MNKKKGMVLCIIVALVLLSMIMLIIYQYGNKEEQNNETIGVIFPGSVKEVGWNGEHYRGVKAACDALHLNLEIYENAAEYSGECEKAVELMKTEGIQAIILESYNYSDEIQDCIKKHPEISFYCCSKNNSYTNYKTYFARVYQARYLSGILAGKQTKTNQIGYVAAMDNNEVNRGINAFTLGVRSVNPDATVWVTYTGSWDDAQIEREEVKALVEDCGIDLVAYHQNQTNVVDEAIEQGIQVIGYNIEQGEYPENLISSVKSNWEMVYKEVLSGYLQKKDSKVDNYWIGIEKDAVELAFYSSAVSDELIKKIENEVEELKNNKEVFSGEIYDNKGELRCGADEVIRDEILLGQMDWLVEGTRIYEKE